MSTADKKGAAVTLLIPATAALPNGLGTVTVNTSYPFEDRVIVTCTVSAGKAPYPLLIRVPGWAKNATIDGRAVAAGSFSKHTCGGSSSSSGGGGGGGGSVGGLSTSAFTLELNPAITIET
jgi:uncharacterized membrane protein YgcG